MQMWRRSVLRYTKTTVVAEGMSKNTGIIRSKFWTDFNSAIEQYL